jgi:hypothetical protein
MKEYSVNGLSEKIKARGNSFSWHKAANEYINVYRTLY